MKEIDARKLSCPAPVLAAKEAIENEQPGIIQVLVDNEAAKQNVSRFLESQSYQVEVQAEGPDFLVTGTTDGKPVPEKEIKMVSEDGETGKIMVMIATDRMGYGDDELGLKLIISFIKTLKEMGSDLWRLVFVNNGVKLTITESEVLDDIKELADSGVHILVCGTCLMHFNLLEEKQVGETTNMLDIVTAMQLADKVINI
ncbi:MAG: sulfurtransferase-like selenium metabolism protein YedF [Desulfobacteraceae bacterium]|nr:sulfurtransferase-like selenium metabolism protein YedF [Desulfobacteraceae bacterium]MBC2755960.1 sulfurtransferase-like selenium metabolism protein YedF [Desulfobacteraceae bacterium]